MEFRRVLAQAQQPDTMTLSVTPGGIVYSVQITSVNSSGYQFGTIERAHASTPATDVTLMTTSACNISEYFGMKVSNSNPDNWAPQSGTPATDQFRLTGE